jgi:hypothetical protein
MYSHTLGGSMYLTSFPSPIAFLIKLDEICIMGASKYFIDG